MYPTGARASCDSVTQGPMLYRTFRISTTFYFISNTHHNNSSVLFSYIFFVSIDPYNIVWTRIIIIMMHAQRRTSNLLMMMIAMFLVPVWVVTAFQPTSRSCRNHPPLLYAQKDHDSSSHNMLRRNSYWILFMDDEESIRYSVGDALYDAGYQVTACADPQACWEVLMNNNSNSNLPDVLISDVRISQNTTTTTSTTSTITDGLELLKRIRQHEAFDKLPVLLLTAKGMTQDRVQGYRAGADAYLSKPFHMEELISIIDNLILRRQQIINNNNNNNNNTTSQTNHNNNHQNDLSVLKDNLTQIKDMIRRKQQQTKQHNPTTMVYFTPLERQVLYHVAQGWTNQEISSHLGRKSSCDRIVQTLCEKTNTRTRTQLVRWALQTGYVPLSP